MKKNLEAIYREGAEVLDVRNGDRERIEKIVKLNNEKKGSKFIQQKIKMKIY